MAIRTSPLRPEFTLLKLCTRHIVRHGRGACLRRYSLRQYSGVRTSRFGALVTYQARGSGSPSCLFGARWSRSFGRGHDGACLGTIAAKRRNERLLPSISTITSSNTVRRLQKMQNKRAPGKVPVDIHICCAIRGIDFHPCYEGGLEILYA